MTTKRDPTVGDGAAGSEEDLAHSASAEPLFFSLAQIPHTDGSSPFSLTNVKDIFCRLSFFLQSSLKNKLVGAEGGAGATSSHPAPQSPSEGRTPGLQSCRPQSPDS